MLVRLGIPLRAVAQALKAEGVYEDEPEETTVGFGMRRSGAPREARQTCERLLRDFPERSRRHLVAVALAEWVGEERGAAAVGLEAEIVAAYSPCIKSAATA